jgi:EmrB/QacA subfamily drug resistance transporter
MLSNTVSYKYLVAAAFTCALFTDILDTTIVNVALPTLGREFHVGNDALQWVMTGYLVSLALWIPASGWIGDRFGTKRTFLFAMAVFMLGSALCGASWNIGSLVAFRILQGVGGGMMTPVGTAMVFRAFPLEERPQASVVIALPAIVAPVVGPLLGGWLTDTAGWRWIFYVNLPIGISGFVFSLFFLKEHIEEKGGRLDGWGFVLSGASLALVLCALSRGPIDGWAAPSVLISTLVGIVCLVLLIVFECRRPEPMLDLRLFSNRMFRNANLTNVPAMAGLIGMLFLIPLFLQQLRGLSALESGLTSFPQALGLVSIMPLAGRLYSRVGPRRLIVLGLAGATVTAAVFLLLDLETDLWVIRGVLYVRGLSLGLALLPLQTTTFSTISSRDTGRASALFSSVRQVASSVGVAVLATVLVGRTRVHAGELAGAAATVKAGAPLAGLLGFRDAFAVAAVLGAFSVAAGLLIRDDDDPTVRTRSRVPSKRAQTNPSA